MKNKSKLLALFIPVLLLGTGCKTKDDSNSFLVKDFLEREVRISNDPEKFVCIGPGALRQYSYVADPSKIIGIEDTDTKESASATKPYVNLYPNAKNLPIVGPGGKNDQTNLEEIAKIRPDVIFSAYHDKKKMDDLQNKTKIPVVCVAHNSTGLFAKDIYDSLKLIGKITGHEEKATKVVNYFETAKDDLKQKVATATNKNQLGYIGSINYRGQHELTYTTGDFPIFDVLGIKNLAKELGLTTFGDIDIEKIREKNPNKIIVDAGGLAKLEADLERRPNIYKDINAFKNHEVYIELPFVFYSANFEVALANAYYIGSIFYPEQFQNFNPQAKFDEIMNEFYGIPLYEKMSTHFGVGYQKLEYNLD